jgi:hypothetical protein
MPYMQAGAQPRRSSGTRSLMAKACIGMRLTLHHRAPNTYYGQWLVSRRPKTRK